MKILGDLAAETNIDYSYNCWEELFKRHAGLLQIVDKYVSQRLTEESKRLVETMMYLVHEPTGVSRYRKFRKSRESTALIYADFSPTVNRL